MAHYKGGGGRDEGVAYYKGGGGRDDDVSHSVKTNISVNSDYGTKQSPPKSSPKLGQKYGHNGPSPPLHNGNQRTGHGGGPSSQRPTDSVNGGGGAPTYQRPPGIQTLQVPGGVQGGRPSLPPAQRRGNNIAASKRTRFALQVTPIA